MASKITSIIYAFPGGIAAHYRIGPNGERRLHREDGPADIWPDGTEIWAQNGEKHRIGGPAVTRADGSWEYWVNGKLHRTDGPAVHQADGALYWFINDRSHRLDGPAGIDADGAQHWALNGDEMPFAEWVATYNRLYM